MSDDILARLRAAVTRHHGGRFWRHFYICAADEIELLREEIELLRAERASMQEAFHQAMWDDTLIPIAEALGISIVDEHGDNRRQFQIVEAIIEETRRD